MAETNQAKATCLLAQITGGALAGLADVEMSQTMPLGLPVGAIGGIVAAGLGFALSSSSGTKGKIGTALLDAGGGMLAFESGTAVVNRVLKAKVAAAQAPAQTAGVAGLPGRAPSAASFVSQTPSNERAVTHEILRTNIARARQHAAVKR